MSHSFLGLEQLGEARDTRAPELKVELFVSDDADDTRASSMLAIHVLAQSANDVRVSLPRRGAGDECILVARAYGVHDRVEVRGPGDVSPESAFEVDAAAATPASLVTCHWPYDVAPPDPKLDKPLQGKRLVVVTNIPIHYRVALFNSVAQRLSAVGASLHIVFTADVPSDRPWIKPGEMEFEHSRVESVDLTAGRGRRMFPHRIGPHLDAIAPHVVVSAGFSPLVSGRVARWCRRRGVPFGIWSGEIPSRPTASGSMRRYQRRRLVASAQFGIAYGWQSATYLNSLDRRLPVVIGRSSTSLPATRCRARSDGPLELLVVSRAESGKALDLVVGAVRLLPPSCVRLTVVGDGPELGRLQALAAGSENIRFLGALPHERVLEMYGDVDAFAFPSSYDIFGLVLVEAMAAGLAVLTSDAPGAVTDLAVDEENCLVVRDPTVDAWKHTIKRVAERPELRQRIGDNAAIAIRCRWTIEHAAEATMAAFRLAELVRATGPR